MPFQKGRKKTGGRKAGMNLAATVRETLERLNCDPIAGLIQIAEDKSTEAQVRAHCYARLSRYVYPEFAPETTRESGNTFIVNVAAIQAPASATRVTDIVVSARQMHPPTPLTSQQ